MTMKKPALIWLKKLAFWLMKWPRIQQAWQGGLGPSNVVFILAAMIGVISGLLAVFLKNGIGWLRQLPWISGGGQGWEIRFVLPTIGLVLVCCWSIAV